LSEGMIERVKEVLSKLREIPEVLAYILLRNGEIIDCHLPEGVDAKKLVSLVATSMMVCEEFKEKLRTGGMQQALTSYENGTMALLNIGNGTILMTVTRGKLNLGKLLLEIEDPAYRIRNLLKSKGGKEVG